ncbi:membrane protein [Spirochaetia bacterium]|nr:membrane protein [Spirochaetia bacterium]
MPVFYVLILVSLFFLPGGAGAEEFFYKHEAGDFYRIISTVKEDVYLDRRLNHRSEILNRIAVDVISVREGRGRHKAVFQTSERSVGVIGAGVPGRGNRTPQQGRSFQWAREYESLFDRDRLGYIDIERRYYMPVVRNVPVFPNRDLSPGDTWTGEGHEMHDFRDSFGIAEPYRIPFTANYRYLGNRKWQDRDYPAFSVSYRISSEPPAVPGRLWPRKITGASDQIVYWDFDMGQPVAYDESFRMIFDLSDGRTIEYRGTAHAEIIESSRMDKEKMAGDIADDIDKLGIRDATVRVVEEGITISLENIQFQADSAVLLNSEQEKLDKIGQILRKYPDRDILVGGHTALAGTREGQNQLSQERAAVAADYLIGKGVRRPERVVVRGYGADRPLGDNRTEEGMRRNRRVEITILEN